MYKNSWILIVAVLLGCTAADEDSQAVAVAKSEDSKGSHQALTKSEDGQHFYNEKFELRVEKPDGWHSQSVEEMVLFQTKGAEMVSGGDENLEALMEASVKGTLPLFGFFEFPPGTPGKKNSSVIATAENTAAFPGIKTGCDYLSNMKVLASQSQLNISFDGDCQIEKISTSSFGYYDATMTVGKIVVGQRFWACKKGDHVISMVQTFLDEEGDKKTSDLMKTINVQCDTV